MRFLFILLIILLPGTAHAQSAKAPTIIENVSIVLARYGWKDRIKMTTASADGHEMWAQFASIDDENFVLNALKQSKSFKQSDGIMLKLFHRGAKKSFREQTDPSLHIVWYENNIEIHFDLHCPGWKHPLKSYKHFREVFMNWWHHSGTSQGKVSARLKKQSLDKKSGLGLFSK